ncbi:two-component system CheB/CheR fusion protein [Flavobacterium sp. CG_9.10]|uniref:chemotaxis protein CheB n=1 Tax=Flavobacterium sp. CG_9.10 TaxID=2787729 RepID=UPI0018CBC22A|nr:chemotaxis protein CheB [Flavobacterium sp. CG_9.10]MBG6111620.1 two-component system CheB/CheR fusion protein [Flavobacterium sp. CG_9.10]
MKLAKKQTLNKLTPEKEVEKESFTVVAIGASAGGLEAVSILLKNLPSTTGMAFIYAQHLNPDHKSLLTTILSKITKMKVQEIDNMEKMEPNNVYVMPPNKEIAVVDGHIRLLPRLKKMGSNLSIDVLFSSLAETHKSNVIGVVLSGYAHDGMIGLKAIKAAGGITFAQDETAQASSMPNSAIATGAVDYILPPEEIAIEIVRLSQNNFLLKDNKEKDEESEVALKNNNFDLNTIFELLLKQTGVDFSHYKMATIKRRISHKMQHYGIKTIEEYVKLLLEKNNEIEILYKDLLINVTSFFREKETFKYLKTTLLPKLLKSKTADDTLRIWIPACSTGQEAYSIAMIISELQDKVNKIPVQIFATDLSEHAIKQARIGEYSQNDMKTISKKYIDLYFTKVGDNYRIVKEVRDMCVFAPHNILRDSPFSRMDFVSCCNLLIYFDFAAQKKVFSSLHFALNDGGYLMLGKAESIGITSQLFTIMNNKYKIYSRKNNLGVLKLLELTPRFTRVNMSNKKTIPTPKSTSLNPVGIEDIIDSILLTNYMPACAVVNKDMDILHFRGPVSAYLVHSSGKASLNILKMARPEFAFELRNAINTAIATKESVYKFGIEIKIDSVLRMMSFEVSPLKYEWDEPLLLIIFKPQEAVAQSNENDTDGKYISSQKDLKIKKLTEELNKIRSEMISIIESQETTYEELQAANEEIVSSNEEFQTLNEELETSKEEIEATNEELICTNQELQMRHNLLTESHEFSEAIIGTIHEPMLILQKDFSVKSANKSFYKKFLVEKVETEGKSLFDLGNKQWNIPKLRLMLNDVISKNNGFENFEVTHTFTGIGEKIMLLNAQLIIQKMNSEQLILLAIEDITDRSRYYLKEKYSLSLIEASLDPLMTLNIEGKITDMNQATIKITGLSRSKLKDSNFFDHFTEPQKACEVYQEVFANGTVTDSPLTLCNKDGKLTDVIFNGSVYKDDKGNILGVVIVARDVTEQKRIEKESFEAIIFAELATQIAEEAKSKAEAATQLAEEAMKAKQQFLSNMSHEIRTPMNAIIGFTKVVLKTELSEKQKEYLEAIKISGDSLIVLIDDILDLAKVDAGKMIFEKKPFKIKSSIEGMLHLFETKIQEKNLELITQFDPTIPNFVAGDPIRLHQIILNLVSNAIKFTNKGSIEVSVHLLHEDKEKVILEFEVTDTGIGIPKEKIARIFENFQQASSGTSRLYGGTGLGLAIVKQLVESQGGSIRVKSKFNAGSTFSFSLTFKKTNEKPVSEATLIELDNKIKNIRVLVVEDIPLNQLLMKTLLDDFGFVHDIAENGKIAIEKLQKSEFDIILMDLQMPEMNGFQATEYIRKTLKLNIPIIALTADVTTVDLAKCKSAGMNDYIAKPLDDRILYSKIVSILKRDQLSENVIKSTEKSQKDQVQNKKIRCINLEYLKTRTKSNATLMAEMISLYLIQTPTIISAMKQSFGEKNWPLLSAAAHKIIPSFSIMGISSDVEDLAKKIQEYASKEKHLDKIEDLIMELEEICIQSCDELKEELEKIKNI